MVQMTENRYKQIRQELVRINDELEDALKEQQKAREAGDLRENEEYATAKKRTEDLIKRKADLEGEIAEAEIVPEDRSPRITIGSVVDVQKVDKTGNPLGAVRRFTIESRGDTVLQKILGTKSSLGRLILNGTDGIYRVPDNGGIYYNVKKIINTESN